MRDVLMHDDQIDVTAETVAVLVREQFPRWAGLDVRPLRASGTVNAIFRLGDALTVRLPLRPDDPAAVRAELEREARASAELARISPFPAPEPVALGEPGAGYPLPWSVQTWLQGAVAFDADPGGSEPFAQDLAAFIAVLRTADTQGRHFEGTGRGGVLSDHDAWMAECFRRSEGLLEVDRLRGVWNGMRTLPRAGDDVMSHGDLIPGNVLVDAGRLAGVLDTGGFGPADPALDLVGAWHLLQRGPREVLRAALGCGDVEWERGRAWAFQQAMGAVWYYAESNPTMAKMAHLTLSRVLEPGS